MSKPTQRTDTARVAHPDKGTPARVFRGVASVLLGKSALDGGATTAMIGLAMHVGVAPAWSTLFVLAVRNIPWVRESLATWPRALLLVNRRGARS